MTSKQRAYLRGLSNKIEPIFQIGKSGVGNNLVQQLNDALEARELIKITVLETAPDSIKNIANDISIQTNSILVQIIGSKITLYKPRKNNPKIMLPY